MENTICSSYRGTIFIACELTLKKASSNTSRGPEKPTTSSGWAPSKQKITPCTEVDTMSSETPIWPSVFSPGKKNNSSTSQWTETGSVTEPKLDFWISSVWLTQQASERNGRRESSKVDKDNSSHALTVQGVFEVAQVLRVAPLHVSYHPTEGASGALQRVVWLFQRSEEGLWVTHNRSFCKQHKLKFSLISPGIQKEMLTFFFKAFRFQQFDLLLLPLAQHLPLEASDGAQQLISSHLWRRQHDAAVQEAVDGI